MKKVVIVLTVLACMFSFTGCGGENEAVAGGNLYIEFEENTEEFKSEDGTVLLTVKSKLPVVDITDNPTAADAINKYVADYNIQGMSIEEAKEWAAADFVERGADNWHEYAMETAFSSQRADAAIISFAADAYSYMGGAHPNSVRIALNFNPQTGERLKLADVTTDEQAAVKVINEFILEQTKQEKYADMFFEDYESSIGDLLTEDTWYLAEDGFHVIGNEYIISPHVAGILDFVIPYSEAGFLKEEYR